MEPEQKTELLEAKAEEITSDVEETKEEVKEARATGDDERASRLQARIDGLATDLSEVKDALKKLAERPFAPAPQPVKKAESEPVKAPEVETPKERRHRFGSTRWFGDRAYED